MKKENIHLKKQAIGRYQFENIVGVSEKVRQMLSLVSKVAASDATVLILGASGTGKELIRITSYNVCYTKLLRPPRKCPPSGLSRKIPSVTADGGQSRSLPSPFRSRGGYSIRNDAGRYQSAYRLFGNCVGRAVERVPDPFGSDEKRILRPVVGNHVITSYSIHYTKLYEDDFHHLERLRDVVKSAQFHGMYGVLHRSVPRHKDDLAVDERLLCVRENLEAASLRHDEVRENDRNNFV